MVRRAYVRSISATSSVPKRRASPSAKWPPATSHRQPTVPGGPSRGASRTEARTTASPPRPGRSDHPPPSATASRPGPDAAGRYGSAPGRGRRKEPRARDGVPARGQVDERPHRPVRAQQRVAQLEQGVAPCGRTRVQLCPEGGHFRACIPQDVLTPETHDHGLRAGSSASVAEHRIRRRPSSRLLNCENTGQVRVAFGAGPQMTSSARTTTATATCPRSAGAA